MRNPTATTGKSCGTDIQTKANAAMAKAKETPSAAIPLLTVGLRRPDRAKARPRIRGRTLRPLSPSQLQASATLPLRDIHMECACHKFQTCTFMQFDAATHDLANTSASQYIAQ